MVRAVYECQRLPIILNDRAVEFHERLCVVSRFLLNDFAFYFELFHRLVCHRTESQLFGDHLQPERGSADNRQYRRHSRTRDCKDKQQISSCRPSETLQSKTVSGCKLVATQDTSGEGQLGFPAYHGLGAFDAGQSGKVPKNRFLSRPGWRDEMTDRIQSTKGLFGARHD